MNSYVGGTAMLDGATQNFNYRYKTNEDSFPYGMYYKFGNVPKIENGFFGIPYST